MLPYLGIQMQSRGRDAWGASDGTALIKKAGPIVDTWASVSQDIQEWEQGIFHTRGASVGTPKLEANAHPFCYVKNDGSEVIGIHNGLVSNHIELDNKYGRKFEVDSQHLWAHRAAGMPWSDVRGWGNLAWWERDGHGQNVMNLCRFNTNSLNVAKMKGGEFIFCSEMAPIITIGLMLGNPVDFWYTVDEYFHYWFEHNSNGVMDLFKGEKQEFGVTPPMVQQRAAHFGGGGVDSRVGFHGHHRGNRSFARDMPTFCYKCNTIRVHTEDEVLCFSCLRALIDLYIEAGEEIYV